jgi:hypothetical protein
MKKNYTPLEKLRVYGQLMQHRARQGHLSTYRQLVEMSVLWIWRGQGPGYYHTAGFWRREISWQDKVLHMNTSEYRTKISHFNKPAYQKLSQNKIPEKGILALFGIPGTGFLGYLHKSQGMDNKGNPLRTPADLGRLLLTLSTNKICCKPAESWAGQGFTSVDISSYQDTGSVKLTHDKKYISLEDFFSRTLKINKGEAAIIETYFEQHEWYSHLNSSSVNTFRLWVVQKGNEVNTKLGYLRIGRAGSMIDNQSSGGIVAPIDLETGVLDAAIDGLPTREAWSSHPDTGSSIEGQKPPFFEEAKRLAERCISCFPGLDFAGVDVAVGKDGPIIIELNVSPDREGAAFTDIPTKIVFN